MTVFKNLVHPEFGELRTVEIDGEPWFVGKDVAAALGYTNSRDAIATHVFADDEGTEKHTIFILTLIKKKKSIRVFMILVDFLLDKI